jgi:hypothetical protein
VLSEFALLGSLPLDHRRGLYSRRIDRPILIRASSRAIAADFSDDEKDFDAFAAGGLRAIGVSNSNIVNGGGVALYVPAVDATVGKTG